MTLAAAFSVEGGAVPALAVVSYTCSRGLQPDQKVGPCTTQDACPECKSVLFRDPGIPVRLSAVVADSMSTFKYVLGSTEDTD